VLRAISLLVYVAVAALGEALLARPALLFLRGVGLLKPVLPWRVPFGALLLLLAMAMAALTVALALRAALGLRARLSLHAALLALLALGIAARGFAGEPSPPPDPAPQLLSALRATADVLDANYQDRYSADAAQIDAALAHQPSPGFVQRGLLLPLRAQVIEGATGPQGEAIAAPGTIYVALSPDRKTAWLTAQSLSAVQALPSGKLAVLEAHAGTHSLPGRDRLVPLYPGMRSVTEAKP
jgi:hypothetical protein